MALPTIMILLAITARACSESSGPFPVAAISEVEIKGGSAQSTAHHSDAWAADKAFILGQTSNGWFMGQSPYGMFPQMVWYEFPVGKTFVPGRISFHPRQDGARFDEGPTMWQFVGSNDESCGKLGHWTVLCEDISNAGYRNKFMTKYCDVDDKILSEFRCLGISVLRTHNKNGYASLKNVRMWKKVFQ